MVTKKTNQTDEAVSPIVGVMLMLVVTIIIAAVVSMFASGMMGDTPTPSTAQVKFLGISSTATDIKLDDELVGLLFEVESGALDLRTLKYYIQDKDYGGGGECYGSYNDGISEAFYPDGKKANPNRLRYVFNNPTDAAKWGVRMMKFTNLTVDADLKAPGLDPEPIVSTGERFILFAESFVPAKWVTSGSFTPTTLQFTTMDAEYNHWISMGAYVNGNCLFTLSDTDGTVYFSDYLKASDVL